MQWISDQTSVSRTTLFLVLEKDFSELNNLDDLRMGFRRFSSDPLSVVLSLCWRGCLVTRSEEREAGAEHILVTGGGRAASSLRSADWRPRLLLRYLATRLEVRARRVKRRRRTILMRTRP